MTDSTPPDPSATIAELTARVRQLEDRLALVQEFTQAGFFERDPLTMQGRWDDHLYRIFGLPVPPPGTPAPDYEQVAAMMLPQDRGHGSFMASMSHAGMHSASVRIRRPDGSVRLLHSQWRVTVDEADGSKRVFGINTDETERYESSRRLEAAAAAARIGLWSTGVSDARPAWSRRMFELFGLDPEGQSLPFGEWIRTCVHPDDRDRVVGQTLGWSRGGEGEIEIEFRVVRPCDGRVRWLVTRGRVVGALGSPDRRMEGIAIDVTEQHETTAQLHDTIERAELARTALGLGIWESAGEQRRVEWDEQMFRLRGVQSPRRVIGNDEVASYLHPEDRAQVMDAQGQRVRNAQPWSTEFRVVWPDGTVRWLASRSVPQLDADGNEIRRLGLNVDITDSKLAEQALRERELALAGSRAKSQFMSRVSHELRTPLNAVLGFTQLLRDGQQDADAATRANWLRHIEEAGLHLLALIDDVLDLSRVDAGEMRLNLQPVPLAELVAATLPLVVRAAEKRQVSIDASGPLDGVVLADPVRLRQVLLNLLSNAIKYNFEGGRVRVWTQHGAGRVQLNVEDTGPGIAAENVRHAFEPFNRLGAEGGTVEGTGIGLAVAKALVEQMGGRIEVDSGAAHPQMRSHRGTVFSVDLPAAVGPGTQVPAGTPAASAGASPGASVLPAVEDTAAHVIYIEDNPVNALLMSELLASRPALEFEVAEDGTRGIARVRQSHPALVLIDMQLPDMDGLAVLRALRADPATARIPCVALSANAMIDDIQVALEAGFVAYWTKPVNFRRLVADLSAVLGRPV